MFCGLTCFGILKTAGTVTEVQSTAATVQFKNSYIIAVIYFSIGTVCVPISEYDAAAESESFIPVQITKRQYY